MAWVNSAPTLLVPLHLSLSIVTLTAIPQTLLLALVTTNTVIIYDTRNLLPLAVHKRLDECMETHGISVEAKVRHISVDTARLDQLNSVNLYVRTKNHFVLIYHVFVNYAKSLYEICDEENGDSIHQNSLPFAESSSKYSITNILKNATMSIIQGSGADSTLRSIEHFNSSSSDDDKRNASVPLAKLTLIKILKLSSAISGFWCKLNSQNLIFASEDDHIQLLNMKSFKSEMIKFSDYKWFYDTALLEYSSKHNFFLHLDSQNELSIIEFSSKEASEISIEHTFLLKVDFECGNILFNPQFDLVVLQTSSCLKLYKIAISDTAHDHALTFVKDIYSYQSSQQPHRCKWSPCGNFLVVAHGDDGSWKIISKFGFVFFDSRIIKSELSNINFDTSTSESSLADFCSVADFSITPNASQLHLINKSSTTLYQLDLLRWQGRLGNSSIFIDDKYFSIPDPSASSHFIRIPILPSFQAILSKVNEINGNRATKKLTGQLSVSLSNSRQLSVLYGTHIAVSTPITSGLEGLHVLWYEFYNHFLESMNVVDHFWIDDYLVIVNRYPREDSDNDATNADNMIDELVIISTIPSKYGAGGSNFKFDSDLIVWRHSFNNKIISSELVEANSHGLKKLVLITSDLKIIFMEVSTNCARDTSKQEKSRGQEPIRLSMKVKKTIHLSSIRHKLPLQLVQQVMTYHERHFFFLLNTGELFLLKNQVSGDNSETDLLQDNTQANNMYDLIKVATSVESIQLNHINFGEHQGQEFLTLFDGKQISIYTLKELVERTYEFEGVERSGDIDVFKILKPFTVQISSFLPIRILRNLGSIEASGFKHQILAKNDNLIIKHSHTRQLILNRFIYHDLFEANLSPAAITSKYADFENFDYCLELLLFECLDNRDSSLLRVCELVSSTTRADSIYVNFLRKIEVRYWRNFFELLKQTPVGFMNRLIESNDVELCYNYLNVYLNFKREVESSETPFDDDESLLLGQKDRSIITKIIRMLRETEKWDECYELCRFIKLLEPLGEFLREIRSGL